MTERKTRLGQLVDAAAHASEQTAARFHPATVRNVTLLAFLLAVIGSVWGLTQGLPFHVVLGLAAMFLGVVSGWAQLSFIMNKETRSSRGHTVSIVMSVLSVLITVVGVVMLFVGLLSPTAILYGSLAGFAMVLAVALIVAPWWITLVANLGAQEAQTAREQVRLDFTARLHDSVLQTLALIQINANDSKKVAALAHAQERDLREWLYGDAENDSSAAHSADTTESAPSSSPSPANASAGAATQSAFASTPADTAAHELKRIVAGVEDATEQQMEVVSVGDVPYSHQLEPLMAAAREAMLNAAHHGKPAYSIYMELNGDLLQIFVRDHGDGFDVDNLPVGHLGVSESILGRMKRSGGTADIDSRPGWGTEVKLAIRLENRKAS